MLDELLSFPLSLALSCALVAAASKVGWLTPWMIFDVTVLNCWYAMTVLYTYWSLTLVGIWWVIVRDNSTSSSRESEASVDGNLTSAILVPY